MMNKKGFEFSIGMIVGLILSILIFSMSLYLVFKWFGSAEELKTEIDKQTSEEISRALKTGLVAIPISIQETKRGSAVNFGVGVRNIATEYSFSMAVSFSGAFTPDGKVIPVDKTHIDQKWLGTTATVDTFTLKKNEEKLIPLMLKADVSTAPGIPTQKGDYVFNVCVYKQQLRYDPSGIGQPYAACTKEQFQLSADAFYTKKIYQIVVRVT
jgi:hypothetical protein